MNLLFRLETLDNPHWIITDVITDAVINQGFDTMVKSVHTKCMQMIVSLCILQGPKDSFKFESLYKKHRTTVGRILDKMLVKIYPPKTECVSMKNILDWDLWPLLITIHSMFIYICTKLLL